MVHRVAALKKRLIFRFIGWFFFANTVLFWLLGLSYLKSIIGSATILNNLLDNFSNYLPGKVLLILFTLVNYASYMMLLAFIPAVFVFLLACIAPSRRLVFFLSILFAVASIICLIVDSRVYAMFKFHINMTLLSFIFSPQWGEIFEFSLHELMLIGCLLVGIFVLEGVLAWFVWKKIILTERFKVGKEITIFWLSGLLFSYLTLMLSISITINLFSQQIPCLPLYSQLLVHIMPINNAQDILTRYSEQHFSQLPFSNDKLHYPLHSMQCKEPKKPYNIILITVDSLRADSLQSSYMPNLTKLAKKSWQFNQHFSGGDATQPGLFSLFYSIPSNYWTAALEQKKSPVLMNVLASYGYERHIMWSSTMSTPPFHKTIYAGLEHLVLDGAPGEYVGDRDRTLTKQASNFIMAQTLKKPFFLHLFYDAPHGYCRYQNYPKPYQPTVEECSRLNLSNETDPVPYYNRYLNAVTFVDAEIGKLLDIIQKQGYLENSIVIFTSDHGQEFNDNHQNYWGHAGNFTRAQSQIPLLIYWPGEPTRQINYVTSSYDIVPTLLMGLFSCTNPILDYSIGQNLLLKDMRLPFILAGSYINMGVIEPDRITTLEVSGRVSVTDTKATPIPNAKPRDEVMNQALMLMRKYF